MKNMLKAFLYSFILVYINDIIIFNYISEKYLKYVNIILTKLKESEISLFMKKCHFIYLSIKLLEHHILRLKHITEEEKIEAIKRKAFSITLKELKTDLEFFKYY